MSDGERDHDGNHEQTGGAPAHASVEPAGVFGFDIAIGDGDEDARHDDEHDHKDEHHEAAVVHDDGMHHEEPLAASVPAIMSEAPAGELRRPNDPELDGRMRHLRAHLRRRADRVNSEEAAKLSLVAPFITSLGYDVFDPVEVVPGYNADGVRADYAVFDDDEKMRILVGYVPSVAEVSAAHLRKLANGVESTGSACAIVTDGRVANVHGLEADGRMDERSLVSVRLLEGDEVPLALHAITKTGWNLAAFQLLGQTERERHVVREAVLAELSDPTNTFLELIEARLREMGHEGADGTRLAIEAQAQAIASSAGNTPQEPVESMPSQTRAETDDDRQMTSEERVAFEIIRDICGKHINPNRVFARPAKSYTAVLLDNNNRKSIARIHFKADRTKYLGTFVGQEESKQRISGPQDINGLNDKIIARVHELDRERS